MPGGVVSRAGRAATAAASVAVLVLSGVGYVAREGGRVIAPPPPQRTQVLLDSTSLVFPPPRHDG